MCQARQSHEKEILKTRDGARCRPTDRSARPCCVPAVGWWPAGRQMEQAGHRNGRDRERERDEKKRERERESEREREREREGRPTNRSHKICANLQTLPA